MARMKVLISIDYAIQGKRIDHPHHTESWLAYIDGIQKGIDTLSKSDTIVPFGLGCWLCSSNTLAPLLDVVRSKRGVLVFQPRVVFLTPEDEETWLPFPKSSLQNAEP